MSNNINKNNNIMSKLIDWFKEQKELFNNRRTYQKVVLKTKISYLISVIGVYFIWMVLNKIVPDDTQFVLLIIYVLSLIFNSWWYVSKVVKGRYVKFKNHYENKF